jgi:hypothetical protein
MNKPVIALGAVLLLAAAACGGGEKAKDAVITVTLTLPDAKSGGAADRGGELLEAFAKEQAGEILAVKRRGRVLEISMKIRELSEINRIKKAIINTEPGAEYRIEHQ